MPLRMYAMCHVVSRKSIEALLKKYSRRISSCAHANISHLCRKKLHTTTSWRTGKGQAASQSPFQKKVKAKEFQARQAWPSP